MPAASRRVILKVSGEALSGEGGKPVSRSSVRRLASEIKAAADTGAEIGIVVGAGNIIRGSSTAPGGAARVSADYMGMVATIVNGLALESALEELGQKTTVMSAIPCGRAAEQYDHRLADAHLAARKIVIFVAGTGNPFFSTDTAAALRAAELGADALLKATKVDGVYDSDPVENPNATRFDELTYRDIVERELGVMDLTAVTLARERELPIVVFALAEPGNIARAVQGDVIGTRVKGGK